MSSFVPNVRHFVLLLPFLLAGCFREKDLLDAEARKLCAKDGGVKVYETVELPSNAFDRFGVVNVPYKELWKPGEPFLYEWSNTYFRRGNPAMWRSHFRLIRTSDGKLLGEAISYIRNGGDWFSLSVQSSFNCPERADISDLQLVVFRKAGGL